MYARHVIHAASWRRGATVVAEITLPRQAQISTAMLSTLVDMFSRGAMQGVERWRWYMYAASSRLFIVKNPWEYVSERMWDLLYPLQIMARVETGIQHRHPIPHPLRYILPRIFDNKQS